MLRGSKKIHSLCLILTVLMLWHYGGLRVYAQTRAAESTQEARAASVAPLLKELEGNRFDSLLSQLKEVVRAGRAEISSAPEKGFTKFERLAELKKDLVVENAKIQESFRQLENFLRQKGMPGEILNRQSLFAQSYTAKYEALMDRLEGIEAAQNKATGWWSKLTGKNNGVDWNGAIDQTLTFLEENSPRPVERHFDPHNLPHRSLKADRPVPPKLTRAEWLKAFPREAANLQQSTAAQAAGAKSGDSISPLATAPPTPADLAETIEVKFTPEIQQLATSLGRNPVRIYNWVRNNIEFVPIWGSIQGAQLCLETRSCNAFDTSSLLISLLRYSGIPARYQMGTIEVPVERFKNWAGGFTNTEAAASLFASGGTPSVVRRADQSGQVVSVRLEHVWVKAFVDYAPSGGSVNLQGDTWVEIDPGFKQLSFIQSVDYEAATPSDSQSFVNQLLANATVDPATGSIANLDAIAVQSFTQQNVNRRSSYLQSNLPNVTVAEAFGGKKIAVQNVDFLPPTLPHKVLARAQELAQIPDQLRHKVTIGVGASPQQPHSADFNYSASLPELADKSVLLLYNPASQADHQLLNVALSASIPIPSLVNVVPELYVGSERVASGQAVRAGSPITSQITFSSPTISTPTILNTMAAGEAAAIGLNLQRVSVAQAQALRQKAEFLSAQVRQGMVGNLTSRDFNEVFLMSHILAWFGTADVQNELTSRDADVVTLRYPSAGLFFYKFNTSSIFGSPVSVSLHGVGMDVDRDIVVTGSKDGNDTKAAAVSFTQGVVGSIMEAEVPSSLLSSPGRPVPSISTIHALQIANSQGIPVYRITSANAPAIIPLLQISPDELVDIQDAINAGLEVTVSKTAVTFGGQNVLGIVIKDSESGSATFLISGGTNGGDTPTEGEIFEIGAAMTLGAAIIGIAGLFAGATLAGFLLLLVGVGLAVGALIVLGTLFFFGPDNALFNLPNWPCIIAFAIVAIIASLLSAGLVSAFWGTSLTLGGIVLCSA